MKKIFFTIVALYFLFKATKAYKEFTAPDVVEKTDREAVWGQNHLRYTVMI